MPPNRRPARRRGLRGVLLCAIGLMAVAASGGDKSVVHALIDPAGLPALHNTIEEGEPEMWIPQFRLFDGQGRLLWSLNRIPRSRKDFRRELEARVDTRAPLAEGRTLRQEARHLLRRGGLPLNLTTLPPTELTVVEYWTDDCGECRDLSNEVDRYFDREDSPSVLIIRVYIDSGTRRTG